MLPQSSLRVMAHPIVTLFLLGTLLFAVQGATFVTGGGGSFDSPLINTLGDAYKFVQVGTEIVFEEVGVNPAIDIFLTPGQAYDYVVVDAGLPEAYLIGLGDTLLPVMGQAIVPTYNLPTLGANQTLVLDGYTLGAIWVGNVSWWNDSAITSLNPGLTLPQEPILLGHTSNDPYSTISQVFARALIQFNPDFAAVFGTEVTGIVDWSVFTGIAARATDTGAPGQAQCDYVKNTPYSMSYSTKIMADATGVKYVHMINKAGATVDASVATVQSAINEVTGELTSTYLGVDALNGNLTTSWPICTVSFLVIELNTNTSDCSKIQGLLGFAAWSQLNPHVIDKVQDLGFTPLPFGYKTKMIDLLGTVKCNGVRAFAETWLIGEGIEFNLYNAWMDVFTSSNVKLRYFANPASVAIADLTAYNVDFGGTNNLVTTSQLTARATSDVVQVPIIAYAIGAAYNVPELLGKGTVVLNMTTLADIMLGTVDTWNHAAIVALNPDLAAFLPNKPITVVTPTDPDTMLLFTRALSAVSSEFATTVGSGTNVRMPVDALGRNINATDPTGVLLNNSYSLGVWLHEQVRQQRKLAMADMVNVAGNRVSPTYDSLVSAINDYSAHPTVTDLSLGTGVNSWPMANMHSFVVHQSTMADCIKAKALVDWIYWTQTDPTALALAQQNFQGVAGQSSPVRKRLIDFVAGMTCNGVAVSSVYSCIYESTICADHGACADGACLCSTGYEGEFCQFAVSSSDTSLAPILGSVIPAVVLALLLMCCVVAALLVCLRMRRAKEDEWEVEISELEMGEQLGAGGYGEVHKAVWKGTEVAVKMMVSEHPSRELERSFKEEVRVMTALRHPNVVLFMAACTKPPKMCIVMEFMALGSLFDLLHNELIPDIPFALRNKMAYQAAKGMHFLHSSGIVHRDLKSLNLLLDSKWNVKVSDFGLTKFKEEMKRGGAAKEIQGSVHWTAPEILNEAMDVDYMMADVYSFGIILWELTTRQQPYMGMSPAAVAVAVIRDNARPPLPDTNDAVGLTAEFLDLVRTCWHFDATIRPTFLEVMTRLSGLGGEGGTSSMTKTSTSSSSGVGGDRFGSWTSPTGHSNTSSSGSSKSDDRDAAMAGTVHAPDGEMAIVFSDITRAASLWEFNAEAMRDATILHNALLRSLLKKHRGYEVVFIRDRNSGEGSFCMAFQDTADALEWCMEAQQELIKLPWPDALLDHPGAAEEWGDLDDRVLFKGLRVRMGVHVGSPRMVRDPMTRRVEYIGPVINAAARITAMTHGGQILVSGAAYAKVQDGDMAREHKRVVCLGKFEMPDAPRGARLYELKPRALEGRFFGGISRDPPNKESDHTSSSPRSGRSAEGKGKGKNEGGDGSARSSDEEVQAVVGEGMMFQEDRFLTSANLCRWVIDFNEIALGRQVGLGSYGVVFRGKWKGVDVAVKRFIKQKLDERRMLEFRAEMALLAELHHPNIVLFIGACVKRPNLCIVTEFVKNGCLRELLNDSATKLTWHQKVKLLHSAALGINYLHSLHPMIVHRDLKPSNLLVDENWNVKVADFGFARIKEENATMTRCGTPCWTAPEVIRGEKYSEKADVFSFGIIMWEVLTRKQPFAGRNFMGVSLDVLEGRRPAVPSDCGQAFKKLMKKCWHAEAGKRPAMEDVVAQLDRMGGNDAGDGKASV